MGIIKAPVFGLLIALSGTYRGLQVRDSSRELGRLTTVAVVQSIFLVIFANAIFAIAFWQLDASGVHDFLLIEQGNERRLQMSSDPLDDLRKLMARYRFLSRPELPRFAGGAVGFLGYEAIHFFEPRVPIPSRDELELPEAIFMIPRSLLVFDHRLRTLKIVINAFLEDGPPEKIYAQAVESIDGIVRKLGQSADLPLLPTANSKPQRVDSNFNPEQFERAVEQVKEYIRAGDVFQAVLSQRFDCDFTGEMAFQSCDGEARAAAEVA